MKTLLADFTIDELDGLMTGEGVPKYRAKQIYDWINIGAGFDGMTNLPKSLRESLAAKYDAVGAKIAKQVKSADGTVKFLFELCDGNLIEGVLMHYKYGYTLCVSTQVGCRMGCAFCASGRDGLLRNLTAGEMLSEVICANGYLKSVEPNARVGNVVLMGSGEPLDNYDNVTKFIRLLSVGQGVGQRGISLSTCGLVPMIKRLADDGFAVTVCISLHSPFDGSRVKVMPTGKQFKVADIMNAAKYYFEASGRRVIVEYAMMRGFNISSADAAELRRITKDFPCHINLIPLNDTGAELKGVSKREAADFLHKLTALGASATIRRSLGEEIEGACGQLKRKYAATAATEDTNGD